jgi:hypothetical protein
MGRTKNADDIMSAMQSAGYSVRFGRFLMNALLAEGGFASCNPWTFASGSSRVRFLSQKMSRFTLLASSNRHGNGRITIGHGDSRSGRIRRRSIAMIIYHNSQA